MNSELCHRVGLQGMSRLCVGGLVHMPAHASIIAAGYGGTGCREIRIFIWKHMIDYPFARIVTQQTLLKDDPGPGQNEVDEGGPHCSWLQI